MRAPFVFATLAVLVAAAWLFTSESAPPRLAAEPVDISAIAAAADTLANEPEMASPAPAERAPVAEAAQRIHVRGRVVDVDGNPVTHGAIHAMPLDVSPFTLHFPQATGARLDGGGDGRFDLELDGPSELTFFSGIATERTIVGALVQSRAAAAGEYEIVVGSIVRVRGAVVDDAGKGLGYYWGVREVLPAAALARLAGADSTRRRWHPVDGCARTDEEGKFELVALWMPGAVLELACDDEPLATQSLPNQDAEGLRFVVPNETVRGVIVRPDGTPIVGATLFDGPDDVLTDAHGRFALPPQSRVFADQILRITEKGGRCVTFENFGRRWIARDPAAEFRVTLDGLPHQIRGTLLNADGTPAAGWYVAIAKRPEQDAKTEDVYRDTYAEGTRTQADGTFVLEHLTRGAHELYFRSVDDVVRFHRAGIDTGPSAVVVRVPDDAVVPVLRGRVVTTRGEPVPNLQLTFDVAKQGGCVKQIGKQRATTNAEGCFEVREVSRDGTIVGAHTEATSFVPYEDEPLVVEPGDRTTIRLDHRIGVLFETRRFDVEGDRIVVFDAQDRQMPCRVPTRDIGSASMYESESLCLELERDGSMWFEVGESAAWVGVYSRRGQVARVPVKLDSELHNRIVWR